MQLYMTQFQYTSDTWKALALHPQDRRLALTKFIQNMGGKLINFYYCLGTYDGIAIYEAPDDVSARAIMIGVTAPGHITVTNTIKLLTVEEAMLAMHKASMHAYSVPLPNTTPVILSFDIQGGKARITWNSHFTGRHITPFKSPYAHGKLSLVVKALNAVQYPDYPSSGPQFTSDEQDILREFGLWGIDSVVSDIAQLVGQALHDGLGQDGKEVLNAVRNYGISQNTEIDYVLRFTLDGIGFAALPWELISYQEQPVLLSRGIAVDSCTRYIDLDRALPPPSDSGKRLHLLSLTPHYGIDELTRQEERDARQAIWNRLQEDGHITYDEISPLTVRALTDYLRRAEHRPDIVHYFGHGVYHDGEGYLVFDDGEGGKALIGANRLAAILGQVGLVVIHACQSATIAEEGSLLTGVAPALSIVTGAVVAMQFTIRTTAAVRFAEVFYDELLVRRRSLQEAVARGRQTLFAEESDGESWYVPTLYIRSAEHKPVYLVHEDNDGFPDRM